MYFKSPSVVHSHEDVYSNFTQSFGEVPRSLMIHSHLFVLPNFVETRDFVFAKCDSQSLASVRNELAFCLEFEIIAFLFA